MLHRRRLLLYKQSQAEPNYDIMVWAASGYNGVVRVNGSNFQLTQDSNNTELWYGTAPSSVTALDYFLKHDSRSGTYNSNSIYVKKVKFGTGMYNKTSNCTTMKNAFCCNGSDRTNLLGFDVRNINTQSVTDFRTVFGDCGNDKIVYVLGLEDWNVSSGTNFGNFITNTNFGDVTFDLHKWHISSNVTNIGSMFGGLNAQALYGYHHKIYYTPGYWSVDPMNNSNLAADRVKPVVYPYHDITVTGNTSFNGVIRINDANVSMTRDNTLGIWYYDLPSGTTDVSLSNGFNYANNTTVKNITSVALKDSVANNVFRTFRGCSGLATVDLGETPVLNSQMFLMLNTTNALTSVYTHNTNFSLGIYGIYANAANIRYIDTNPYTISSRAENIFYACSNLIRIKNFPSITSDCDPTSIMYNCTALTTIENCGDQYNTIDFSPCPLNLSSAKVILNALQTVTSETLTFSSTTNGYINADSEALALVSAARSKGWTITL